METKRYINVLNKKCLILIFITAVFCGSAVSESYGDASGTGTELLWEDGLPCLTTDLPEGYKIKRDKCNGVCGFAVSKHFYDYPLSRKKKKLLDKIRNQTEDAPYNEAFMNILIGREDYTDDLSPAGSVEKNDTVTGDGRKITWSTIIIDKKMIADKKYLNLSIRAFKKYRSQALLKDIYGNSADMTKPAEKLSVTFLISSRTRKGISELQSIVKTMRLSSIPCRDSRKIRYSELQKMSPEKQVDTIMNRLERDEYEFNDNKCRYGTYLNELTNEQGDVYLTDDLTLTALEQIIPIGKDAVPTLVRWLRHSERQMRYIAFFSLETITGERAPYFFFEQSDESDWIEKYSKKFLRWYDTNSE